MLGDITQNWIQEYVVGDEAAVLAQQGARLLPQFQARMDWDQLVPAVTSGKHGGFYFHRLAIGLLPVLEAPPVGSQVRQMVIFPTADRKFPVTVQMFPDPMNQGTVLHVFATFGYAVVVPAWGSYMETI
jgi:hypothetical protein